MLAQICDGVMINTNFIGAIELSFKDNKWIIFMRYANENRKEILGTYEQEKDARIAYKDIQDQLQRVNDFIYLVSPHDDLIPSVS